MKNIINIDTNILAKLPAKEFAARLMALPPSEGLELLLDRPDAEAVVHSLQEQDFYLFLKEAGGENALSLLGLSRIEQFNHILDVEGWNRDQVKPGKTLAWLEALLKSNNQKFLEWLYKVDFELLVTLFKKWLDVQILPEDTEYIEVGDNFPADTLDDQYYFTVKYPQYTEMIKSVLGFLFETHHSFYRELMGHIITALDAEVEELAYQFHHGRLSDNAIPDFDEAVSIYRPLKRNKLNQNKTVPDNNANLIAAPFFAMMLVPKHDLLTEALVQIDNPAMRNTLQMEFASLANKIIIAGDFPPDNPENLKNAADKATAYVNLALEEKSQGESSKATALIENAYIDELFRLAHTKVTAICQPLEQLVETGWISLWPHGLNLLDQEWYEHAASLLTETPKIFRKTPSGYESREDLIRSRKDLQQAKTLVDMLTHVTPLFEALKPESDAGWDDIDRALWKKSQHQSLDSVTLGSLIITAAVQKIWNDSWTPAPLPRKQWGRIFPLISIDKIKNTIAKHCENLFTDDADIKASQEYMEPIFKNFREDMEAVQGGPTASPHLLPQLLFTDK